MLKWGSANAQWEPSLDVGGNYAAGAGLTLTGTTFALDLPYADGRYWNESQSLGGDVTGTAAANTVARLQGRALSATAPTGAQVLKWNAGTSLWEPAADAGSSYGNGAGLTLTGTTFALDLPYADGRYWNESQSLGGDVTGTAAANTVTRLRGNVVSGAVPTHGQVLKWNITALLWEPAADSGPAYTAGTGQLLGGTTFSLDSNYTDGLYWNEGQVLGGDLTGILAATTVARLQNRAVSATGGVSAFGTLVLNGTAGQPIAGAISAGTLTLAGGFWQTEPTPCCADCDPPTGRGVLDIFDFLCFQDRFDAGDPYACDCDTSSGPLVCDIFDFLCFQNAYDGGCP